MYKQYDDKLYNKLLNAVKIYTGHIFKRVADVGGTECFRTKKHLREVPESGWTQIAPGERWGGEYENLWVRGTVEVTPELVGKKLYLMEETGAQECLVFIGGKPHGIFNRNRCDGNAHFGELIGTAERAGQTFDVAVEGYAWHYEPGCAPYDNYGQDTAPEGAFMKTYRGLFAAVMDDEIKYFCVALKNLVQLARETPEDNTVRYRAADAIGKLYPKLITDPLNRSEEDWRAGIVACNEIMREFYASSEQCGNLGYVGIIGHSHMDTAWLWPVAETVRKCARTYANALSLMEQYPEYKFVQSSALHCDWMREYYPTIFADMKKRVAEGRYEPNGGVWVECDCNITSGEFMVRQFLKGQQFYREQFGVTTDCFWLPDTFGYSAAIPQIMLGSGVKYFYTTKISWNDLNAPTLDTFYWRGLDGSAVLTHFNIMHCDPDVEHVQHAVAELKQRGCCPDRLVAFGYGDGGGGPNFTEIEDARITTALGEIPKTEYTTVSAYMKRIEKKYKNLPTFSGELYLEKHRGTLTQAHEIKRNNRKAEFAVRDMEYFNALARKPLNPRDDEYVKLLLKNQFHDILPGSSMEAVNIQARAEVTGLIADLRRESGAYLDGLTDASDALTAYNTLSFERNDTLYFDADGRGAEGFACQEFTDIAGATKLAVAGVAIPAFGAANLSRCALEEAPSRFKYDGSSLETPTLSVKFDEAGYIASLVVKSDGREIRRAGGAPLNTLYVAEDVPTEYDNWDVDFDTELKYSAQRRLVSREVAADGAVLFILRSVYAFGACSSLTQDMIFRADSEQIDFRTVVDWKEKHAILKAGFDVDIFADFAANEVQYGHVFRPTTRNNSLEAAKFEVCNYKWTDLSEPRRGVAILNDCKYAISVKGSDMRLSLHRGGCRPDPTGDRGIHEMTYSLLPHDGSLSARGVIRPAYMLNVPAVTRAGSARVTDSYLTISSENVICEALKPAESGENAVIARLYECERTHADAVVTAPDGAKKAYLTNLLEDVAEELPIENGAVRLAFRPFEIKTVEFKF